MEKVSSTIIACCILHNICLEVNDPTEIDAKIVLVKTKPLITKIYFAFDELRQLFVLTPVLLINFLVIELFIGGLPVDLHYCLKSFRLRQKRKMS